MPERRIDGLNAIARELEMPVTSFGEPFPPMPFMRFEHPNPTTYDAFKASFYLQVQLAGLNS